MYHNLRSFALCFVHIMSLIVGFLLATVLLPIDFICEDYGQALAAHISPKNGTVTQSQQQKLIKQLFTGERFDELEKIALEIRGRKERFPDGGWRIYAFYDDIPTPSFRDALSWKSFMATLERWQARYPQSPTARTALARGYYRWAWDARGPGFAEVVTEDDWVKFRERLARAWAFVEKPASGGDCHFRHVLRINISFLLGAPKSEVEGYYTEAMAYEPQFLGFINTRAV